MTSLEVCTLIFAAFFSCILTYYIIPFCIAIAYRYSILDIPDGKVKKQRKPVAYLGGVAIYLGFIFTLALIFPFCNNLYSLVIGSTLLLFIGLVDDLYPLKPMQKIIGQGVATLCFLRSGLYLKEQFFMAHFWGIPFSAFWILSIINAFNLLDVADGLAITTSLCASLLFFLFAFLTQSTHVALLLSCLIGAQIAFFWYNKPPATIYLGDAGSLFLGGIMATIPFSISWGEFTCYGWLIPSVILGVACSEIMGLVVLRSYNAQLFWRPSEHHVAHRVKKRIQSTFIPLWTLASLAIFQTIISLLLFWGIMGPLGYFLLTGAFFIAWLSL